MPPTRAPQKRKTKTVTIPGTTVKMEAIDGPKHPLVPKADPTYVFRQELVEEVAYAVETHTNCMLVGGTGIGKSSLIVQLAAFLNQPLRREGMHGESDTEKFIGKEYPTVVAGERQMIWRNGILADAMLNGHWFLADEWDAALQPILYAFQSVLEDNARLPLNNSEGTVVTPTVGWQMFGSGNTIGIASKDRLLFAGTNRQNEATLDRWGTVIYVDYPDEHVEFKIISQKVPDLDVDFVRAILMIAKEVRGQLKDEQLSCSLSTRRCIDWARAMTRFPPMRAAKLAVLNKVGPEDYKILEGVIQRVFGT